MSSERYAEVIKGVNLIWNNKFEEAEKLFETKKGTSPRYALHYAECAFLRSFITADQEDTQLALTRLKTCKDLAEEHLKSYDRGVIPGSPVTGEKSNVVKMQNDILDTRIVFGDTLYMIAILQMTRDAKIKGAFNLRKSWKVFEKALKDSKQCKELDTEISRSLQFGAGFFLFAMSIIPQKFLKLVELAGFKADKDTGLHYIRECHKNGGIRAPFSTMVLLFNNLLLPRGLANADYLLTEADALIQESIAKYPEGSLFHVMGSHCARKQCNIEKGIQLMETALNNSKTLKQPPLIYRYELANCYCMKLEFKKAAEIYTPLIEVQKFQVRALATLQLAGCFAMLGEKDKAHQLFTKLSNFTTKGSLDGIVVRQAKRYVQNGGYFAAFELLYLRRDLAKMIPIMKEVLQSLDKAAANTRALEKVTAVPQESKKLKIPGMGNLGNLGKLGSSFNKLSPFNKKTKEPVDPVYDDRASYLLLRGSMVKSLGKHDEAVACFREVIDVLADLLTEKLYIPYCLYELGESYYVAGQVAEAQDMMKRCSKFSGYDWEDPLRVRLRVTMEQLKKGTLSPSEAAKPPMSLEALTEQQLVTGGDNDSDEVDGEDDYKLSESGEISPQTEESSPNL